MNIDGMWAYNHLGLLRDVVRPIDGQLGALRRVDEEDHAWGDMGGWDTIEHLTGLGFAACQTFINTCARRPKEESLELGPQLRDRHIALAQVVNAASNYWKHHDEWVWDPSVGAWKGEHARRDPKKDTIDLLCAAGFYPKPERAYLCTELLVALTDPQPAVFSTLVSGLEAWLDALPPRS